eukprot:COSAG04_NODE_24891_length_315_cov_0.958333_1_plen_104_part_11
MSRSAEREVGRRERTFNTEATQSFRVGLSLRFWALAMAVKGRIFFTPGGPLGDALPDTASGGAAALRQVPRRQSGAVSSYMASLTEPDPEPEPGADFFVGAQTA